MPISKIAHILSLHSVPFFVRNGRIYADTMQAFTALFAEVEDLTDYTPAELRAWLGY